MGNQFAEAKLHRARNALLVEQPFFGTLALRLRLEDASQWLPEKIGMAVDGKSLFYHPSYILGESMDNLKGVIAHEVMHCGLGHPWRRGGRDQTQWNEACDYAINPLVLDGGLRLPSDMLMDPNLAGLSAETI